MMEMRRSTQIFFCCNCGSIALDGYDWQSFGECPACCPPDEEAIAELVGDGTDYDVTIGCCPRCQEQEV